MGPAGALVAAAAVSLLATPGFRSLARAVGLVDRPAARKVHTTAVPYLGGMAVALGVLVGLLLTPGQGLRVGAIAVIGAVMCALGLADDDRELGPKTRLAVEVGGAVATVALGLRFGMTGILVVDAGLTVLWIVGLTNAANLLDNMDGLSAGVAGSVALSSMVVLGGTGRHAEAALAAAVVGACLGFLMYNKRPASIYMGDAGSLLLGYLLAVLTLAATQHLPAGERTVVPLMLAAVPLADTATVVMARLRRGISPATAGKDHLSHRLVRAGLRPGPAVVVLIGASLACGMLGALAGRGAVTLAVAVAGVALVLGALLRTALPAPVYDAPVVGLPGKVRRVAIVGVGGVALALAGGVLPLDGAGPAPFFDSRPSDGAQPLFGVALLLIGVALASVTRRRLSTGGLKPLVLPTRFPQMKEG